MSAPWRDVHERIKATIDELGGKVVPKLNWSAPKDATWINPTNSMECRSPNDIYLMLKSSDFVTHDLEHAFDDTVDDDDAQVSAEQKDPTTPTTATAAPTSVAAEIQPQPAPSSATIPYHLILRKYFQLNPSLEFRCFARHRRLLCLCQRDLNHFPFLSDLRPKLLASIQTFFDKHLRDSFPDENFVFDVYVPPPHDRVWLVDVNPWAQRTDPLLFSWLEILNWVEPPKAEVVRLEVSDKKDGTEDGSQRDAGEAGKEGVDSNLDGDASQTSDTESDSESDADEEIYVPELRLVNKDDPEAYGFTTPQYSAHKLPRDVVDASRAGGSELREFAQQWKEALAKAQRDDEDYSDSDGD